MFCASNVALQISRVAGTYLRAAFIWRFDATNYFNWDISIFCITLTELTSFDFDYIVAGVLILGQHLLTLSSHMQCLFEGSTWSGVVLIWNKYGLVNININVD